MLLSFLIPSVVGSSFGGAVLIELLKRKSLPPGPLLLLAPAHQLVCSKAKMDQNLSETNGHGRSILICHGVNDSIVPLEHSKHLSTSLGAKLLEIPSETHQLDKSSRTNLREWIGSLV